MDDQAVENNIRHMLCDICNLSFNGIRDLNMHKILHSSSKSQNTSKKNKTPTKHKEKLTSHHYETRDKNYSDASAYKSHTKIYHSVRLDSKQKQINRKKKFSKHYCEICLKYFTQISAFKLHMKTYHVMSDINKHDSKNNVQIVKTKSLLSRKKSTKDSIGYFDNIFIEFENRIPLEMRNDQYRCNMCYVIAPNLTEYMEHEKKHYQIPLDNNPGDAHIWTTVDCYLPPNTCSNDDDMTSKAPNQHDDITCDTASNNKNMTLNTINDHNNTLDTNADNINTSDRFNNNQISDITKDKSTNLLNDNINLDKGNDNVDDQVSVTHDNDDQVRTTNDDHNNDNRSISSDSYVNGNALGILHYDCSNLVSSKNSDTLNINLLSCEENEHKHKTENNTLSKGKIKILQKHTGKDHLKALAKTNSVPQQFYCNICKDTCERMDHFQYNQWWSPCDQVMECYVCCKKFSDKKELQLHEMEHVKTMCC